MIDIDWSVLLGDNVAKVVRPQARRLSTKIPTALKRYNEGLDQHFQRHSVLPKLHEIYRTAGTSLHPWQQAALNGLDTVRKEGMIFAEKRCRKLCMGEVDFSPQLSQARRQRDVWRLVRKLRSGRKVSSSLIKRKAQQCGITRPLSVTLKQAEAHLAKANKRYRDLKPRAPELRLQFLQEQARDPTVSEAAQQAARRMMKEEEDRRAYRFLRSLLGRERAASVSVVKELVGDTYVAQEGQEAVEGAIMTNNEARFRLTEDTPPMTAPLVDDLGYLGCTDEAKQILDGTYVPPAELDEYGR